MQLELRMTGDPALAHAHSAAPSDRGLVHHGGGGAELGNGAEGRRGAHHRQQAKLPMDKIVGVSINTSSFEL